MSWLPCSQPRYNVPVLLVCRQDLSRLRRWRSSYALPSRRVELQVEDDPELANFFAQAAAKTATALPRVRA